MQTNSEMIESVSPEVSRQDLAEKVLESLVTDKRKCEEILSKVKWSLGVQKKKNETSNSWNSDAISERVEGNLRGFVTETVSENIPLYKAENVFSSGEIPLETLKVVSPQEFAGSFSNKKGDVMSTLLRRSLEDKPLRVFDPEVRVSGNPIISQFKEKRSREKSPQVSSQEYGDQLRRYLKQVEKETIEQIIQGYTYSSVKEKDGSTTPAGEWYDTTVIPDGIIVNEGVPVGVVEVKAYQTEELGKLLSLIRASGKNAISYKGTATDFGKNYQGADTEPFSLGVDLNSEVAFVDILRGLADKGKERDTYNLIVLRFPNDIPNNILSQYGEMIVSYGYRNVVIQKLPFSNSELDDMAKEVVRSQWGSLSFQLLRGGNFSDRELNILEQYIGGKK